MLKIEVKWHRRRVVALEETSNLCKAANLKLYILYIFISCYFLSMPTASLEDKSSYLCKAIVSSLVYDCVDM